MDLTLHEQYAQTARYDYVKFSFKDNGAVFTNHVRDEVAEAFALVQAKWPGRKLVAPNYVFLQPAKNRPFGLFIVELFGLAATCVEDLPTSWMADLSYAHVKSYGNHGSLAQLKALQTALLFSIGRRTVALTQGGTAGRSDKGMAMPSVRIGSRKSDWHAVMYARKGENLGVEGRYRDDRLANHTLTILDIGGDREVPSPVLWRALLRRLARDSADLLFQEFVTRGIDLQEVVGGFDGYARYPDEREDGPGMADDTPIDVPPIADLGDTLLGR